MVFMVFYGFYGFLWFLWFLLFLWLILVLYYHSNYNSKKINEYFFFELNGPRGGVGVGIGVGANHDHDHMQRMHEELHRQKKFKLCPSIKYTSLSNPFE